MGESYPNDHLHLHQEHDQLPSVESYKVSVGYARSGRSKSDLSHSHEANSEVDLEHLQKSEHHDQLPGVEEYKFSQEHTHNDNSRFWKIVAISSITLLVVLIVGLTVPLLTMDTPPEATMWWLVDSDRYYSAEKYLIEAGISTAEKLKDTSSPQHKAAKWLANKDGMKLPIPRHMTETAPLRFVERYILAVFYYATDGPNWTYQLNFLTENHVCTWYEPFTVKIADTDLDGEYATLGVHGCKLINDELVPFAMFLREYHHPVNDFHLLGIFFSDDDMPLLSSSLS